MHKASRLHFRKAMADYVEQAEHVHRIAVGILAAEHQIPESHYQHGAELSAECVISSPGLAQDVALLTELNEHAAAADAVRAALVALKKIDPFIFDPAPSARLLAALQVGLSADASQFASALCSADYADNDTRRRLALKCKRALHAAGLPIAVEADIAGHPTRDQAVADAALNGLKSSRRNNG